MKHSFHPGDKFKAKKVALITFKWPSGKRSQTLWFKVDYRSIQNSRFMTRSRLLRGEDRVGVVGGLRWCMLLGSMVTTVPAVTGESLEGDLPHICYSRRSRLEVGTVL